MKTLAPRVAAGDSTSVRHLARGATGAAPSAFGVVHRPFTTSFSVQPRSNGNGAPVTRGASGQLSGHELFHQKGVTAVNATACAANSGRCYEQAASILVRC
jgi:hypothetical protein